MRMSDDAAQPERRREWRLRGSEVQEWMMHARTCIRKEWLLEACRRNPLFGSLGAKGGLWFGGERELAGMNVCSIAAPIHSRSAKR